MVEQWPSGKPSSSPRLPGEFVLEPTPGSDSEPIALQPPDCPSRDDWARHLNRPPEPEPPPPPPPRWPQFSLSDLLILTVGIAAGLAGGSWMPTDVFAAILGLITLVGLLVVSWQPPETHLGKLIWATVVISYIVAVGAAIFRPLTHPGL